MGLPLDATENSPLKKLLNRLVAGGLTVLVVAVIILIFQLGHLDKFVEQLELKTYDLRAQVPGQMGLGEPKHPSSDVVILQFDDPSLNVLNDEYGVWPWPRDVHAHMMDFLNKAGVRMMLYDIMFVAPRKGSEEGDRQLEAAFKKYNNVFLSMNFDSELAESQKLGKDLTPRDIELLEPLSIPLHNELGTKPNSYLKLVKSPYDGTVFFDNGHMTFNHYRSIMPILLEKGSHIGIINHGADEDGVSRGNPLFFRFVYTRFMKTRFFPLHKDGTSVINLHAKDIKQQQADVWYDAKGNRTDADGYMLIKAKNPPKANPDGGFVEDVGNTGDFAQQVDQLGYLMDGYNHYIYQREMKYNAKTGQYEPKLSYMYFPYLGLRAVLDTKFKKTPELFLTADGHLKFEGYDIPLSSNGDFLVNWYNVNITWDEYRKNKSELENYQALLKHSLDEMKASRDKAKTPEDRLNADTAMKKKEDELDKVGNMIRMLDQALSGEYEPQPYERISAWQVIGTMKKVEQNLPLTEDDQKLIKKLRNKTVFIGATAVAAYDIKTTSIHSTMPGVVLQASLFDNLYQNDLKYMHRLDPPTNGWITILLCLIAAGFTFKMRSALAGMLTTANMAVLYVLSAILLYQYQYLWVNIAMPLVALVITTTVTFMVKYILRDKDYEKTYALATTDSMTGLYNHRFFQDHMRRSIEQANRFKHKFSLVLIDIDFFKKFNDTYGHQAGDEVLRHVARKLKKSVRNVDVVARYGGEEMAIILDRATEEEALAVAQKVVKAIAEEAYPIAEGVAKHVTISCGVATYPTHGNTPSELIEFSDAGLYRAKENGRNQVGAQYDNTHPPEGGDGEETHAA